MANSGGGFPQILGASMVTETDAKARGSFEETPDEGTDEADKGIDEAAADF